MPEEGNFDLKRVLDKSSSKTTISELAKKGIQHVKILDEATLKRLIKEAVENTAVSKANLLTDQERTKIYEESKKELDRLVKEYNDGKAKSEKYRQDYEGLVKEVENLRRQLELTKKTYEERIRQIQSGSAPLIQQPTVIQPPSTTQDDLLAKLDELSRKDDLIANKLSAIFAKAIDGITKKVTEGRQLIQQPQATPEVEYKPNMSVLDNILQEALESNLDVVQSEKKTASNLQEAINKLKSVRSNAEKDQKP